MIDNLSRRTILALGAAAAGKVLLGGSARAETPKKRRVVAWSEGKAPKEIYPKDVNGAVAEGLKPLAGWEVVTASFEDPEQGCSQESLDRTDVMLWFGHAVHHLVKDEYVDRIVRRVKEGGMGFISLHSSHFAKPYVKLMGTSCDWRGGYRDDGSGLEILVKDKQHPIARGVSDFTVAHTEYFGEPYQVPKPDSVVFDGIYTRPDGTKEHARHGMTWSVGKGKVFYLTVGHEAYPLFYDERIQRILRNAVEWAAPKA